MLKEITNWEDFDDEPKNKSIIGFASPVIIDDKEKE